MKRKKKAKTKKNKSNKNEKDLEVAKEVGIYNDFLVYEKKDKLEKVEKKRRRK